MLCCLLCRGAWATELDDLRKHMRSDVDEVEKVKWIHDKTTPRRVPNKMFYVYLGQSQTTKAMWPRLRMGFIKDNWIFFDKIILNIDGVVRRLSFEYSDVSRDYSAGTVLEFVDIDAEEHIPMIKSIGNSKKTTIRFSGKDKIFDFVVSKEEQKEALKRVLRLYELMK